MLDRQRVKADVEHAPLLLEVLGQPVWQEAGGGVVQDDVRPFPALHRVDRRQRDPVIVGRGAQVIREPHRKPARIALELGQLHQGVEIVTVG